MINTDTDIANDAPQLIGYRAVTFDICTVIEQNRTYILFVQTCIQYTSSNKTYTIFY